jgi:hypothetical protein
MPFEQLGADGLTETFEFRLSPSDKQWIRGQAELSGLSMAEFVRRRALGLEIVPKSDLLVRNELRKFGGMLKDSLNKIKTEAGQIQVFMTMASIRDYLDTLTNGRKKNQKSK